MQSSLANIDQRNIQKTFPEKNSLRYNTRSVQSGVDSYVTFAVRVDVFKRKSEYFSKETTEA